MKKKNKKVSIIIFSIIILFAILALLYFCILKNNNSAADNEYADKMKNYSLYELYTSSNNKVTKLELLKIVICATNNSNILPVKTTDVTDNDWIEYGKEKGYILNNSITIDNCYKKAKYIDAIEMISNAKYYILLKDYDTSKNVQFSDLSKYSENEQKYIKDLVANEILENRASSLKGNNKLTKNKLNELVVKYIEKFNLLTSGTDNIEKDEEKMPSNKDEYVYISKDVEKEVYEQPYVENQSDTACNSLEYYKSKKDYFDITAKICEDYYNIILNVDYKTIDYESLKSKLQDLVVGSVKEEALKTYVEYVKNNKIVLNGKATVQMPCIYYDGLENIVRTKLEFEVVESSTNENLLFMDLVEDSKKMYNSKNLIYIDARMGYVLDTEKTYVYQNPLHTMLLEMSKDKIEVK